MADAHVPAHQVVAGRNRLLQVAHRETKRIRWYGEDVAAGRRCLLTQTGLPDGPGAEDEAAARRIAGRVLRMAETMGRLCPGRVPAVVDAVVERGAVDRHRLDRRHTPGCTPRRAGRLPPGAGRADRPAERTAAGHALVHRVVFGADGDARTPAVTSSERVGPDPVAVWREDVEPELKRAGGCRRIGRIGRIGAIRYQGREAADMQWLATADGSRTRAFGRGFLLGGGRGCSLRFTTPAADWSDAADRQALEVFLRTFRPGSG